ncbi:MAG: DUF962 domain-containing protein [Candidatus Melainabacteria bacterium]|nr:DUF962 domain-containing protein [Candidatus Melainabacteria bacterium]
MDMQKETLTDTQKEYAETLQYYKSQHTTLGCKVTHMIGVPMIALSVPMLLISPRRAANLFAGGWALQFIGHYVFEKNSPVVLTDYRNPMVILAALDYVAEGWVRLFKGLPLIESKHPELITMQPDGNGKGK